MDKIIGIKFALETLRFDSMRCPMTEVGTKQLMKKYKMMFLGVNLNHIYSHELCHTLKNKFGLEIEPAELHELLPSICQSLNMTYESLQASNNVQSSLPFEYQITLFKK